MHLDQVSLDLILRSSSIDIKGGNVLRWNHVVVVSVDHDLSLHSRVELSVPFNLSITNLSDRAIQIPFSAALWPLHSLAISSHSGLVGIAILGHLALTLSGHGWILFGA
jgi:hypothetical protein